MTPPSSSKQSLTQVTTNQTNMSIFMLAKLLSKASMLILPHLSLLTRTGTFFKAWFSVGGDLWQAEGGNVVTNYTFPPSSHSSNQPQHPFQPGEWMPLGIRLSQSGPILRENYRQEKNSISQDWSSRPLRWTFFIKKIWFYMDTFLLFTRPDKQKDNGKDNDNSNNNDKGNPRDLSLLRHWLLFDRPACKRLD